MRPHRRSRDGAAKSPHRRKTMKLLRPLSIMFLSSVSALAIAQAGPSDPQIAGIVVAANQIDVDAGKLAKSQSKNKEVQDFAQQMITDHTAVNKQAAAETTNKLKGLKGAQFDKAYVDNEVAFHQQVLDAIDKVLIPSAQNKE